MERLKVEYRAEQERLELEAEYEKRQLEELEA